MRFWRTIPSWK